MSKFLLAWLVLAVVAALASVWAEVKKRDKLSMRLIAVALLMVLLALGWMAAGLPL